jgi:hypothetical protein
MTFSDVAAPGLSVDFGKPWRMVFWREAQYVGCYDIDGLWITSEWLETLGNNSSYDFEPISDKGARYTFPRVIETGPARTVVHWQYALCDTTPEAAIFHGNTTAEELFYIYPDGFTVRTLTGWPGNLHRREGDPLLWETGELIIINPKGTTSLQNIHPHAATFSNCDGDEYRLGWDRDRIRAAADGTVDIASLLGGHLCTLHPSSADWGEFIITANLVDRPRFFLAFPNREDLFPRGPCVAGCSGTRHPSIQIWKDYPSWKHWPLWKQEYHIGKSASEADMLSKCSHTSIASIDPFIHPQLGKPGGDVKSGPFWTPPRPSSWVFLMGVTPASERFVRGLVRSWLTPAAVEGSPGYDSYDISQRAYHFTGTGRECRFTLVPAHPLVNPVFIFDDWQCPRIRIELDGVELPEYEYARSWRDQTLVLWLSKSIERRTVVAVSCV